MNKNNKFNHCTE